MAVKCYRDLEVWKVSMELAESVYRLTARLPTDERYGLISQMRRAAVSVPSNIAEGAGRAGRGEYLQHLSVTRGSLMELETQLTLTVRLALIEREWALGAWSLCERVSKMLNRLTSTLRQSKR